MADGERCSVPGGCSGRRAGAKADTGAEHPSPLGREAGGSENAGKVDAWLFCICVSKNRALQEEGMIGANADGVL